jgi:hypothetical protein
MPWRQQVQLGLELGIEPVDILHVDIARIAPFAARLQRFVLDQAESDIVPPDIGIAAAFKPDLEAERVGEEGDCGP